ncbi:MAG: UbiA family prenyltransferase [bacterium]
MNKTFSIIEEIRVHHWIKNLIIFFPIFFGGAIFTSQNLFISSLVFILFSFTASIVYLINDIKDVEEDRQHPSKKNRPLASGQISNMEAYLLILFFFISDALLSVYVYNYKIVLILIAYLITNLLYTFYLKKIALWDIIFVSGMYLFRLYSGSAATDISVSGWLFTTVFFGSLILIISKRYCEIRNNQTRFVLKKYTPEFLHSLLLISLGITITAFTTYSINLGLLHMPSIVLFTLILFRYYYIVETESKGEKPEFMFFSDKQLFAMVVLFVSYSAFLVYVR